MNMLCLCGLLCVYGFFYLSYVNIFTCVNTLKANETFHDQRPVKLKRYRAARKCLSLSLSVSVCLCLRVVQCGRGVVVVVVCVWCVCVCVCSCVCVCVCAEKNVEKPVCGFKNASVCTFKTSQCVPAPRAHVFQHVRVEPVHTGTFRTYTRGTGVIASSAYHNLHTYGYHVLQTLHGHLATLKRVVMDVYRRLFEIASL